ncbi:hypothetical protein ACS0TY_001072 [Phlomoides rotata]
MVSKLNRDFMWDGEREMIVVTTDEATSQCDETHDEGSEAMGEDDEIKVSYVSISRTKTRARSSSSIDFIMGKTNLFQELFASKKNEKKSSGIEIRNVVKMIPGLSEK